MSSTSFDSEEFRRAHERRRIPRLRLPSLAYVDVDSDNGGILLNLSETGLALQAVAPFADLTRVALRIQPPKPRQRLELNAKIVWLSESKKEAGLQFRNPAPPANPPLRQPRNFRRHISPRKRPLLAENGSARSTIHLRSTRRRIRTYHANRPARQSPPEILSSAPRPFFVNNP
jgi:hypothetical protein